MPLSQWTARSFTHEGLSLPVYVRGDGPAVIVMHEIPNLHPGVIRFAERVVQAGFTVWMPSILGRPEMPSTVLRSVVTIPRVCISRAFTTFALRRTSPLVRWMRALSRHAGNGQPTGAIGMCLTGGFALAMAVDAHLQAPVLSQPSLPFSCSPAHAADLNLSDADLSKVKQRCATDGLCVLGLRFSHDILSPAARFRRLTHELGDAFLAVEIDASLGNPHGIPPWAHSVLGVDYNPAPGHPTVIAEDRVLSFFRERLLPPTTATA